MRVVGMGVVLAHWRAERRTIRQGFAALVTASLGNLVAGLTLGSITGTLEMLPGLIVLVPAAIGMRGNIFGALGSRLGTSIHAGLFEASRRRQGILYQNVYAATLLTVAISVALGILARTLSLAFGAPSISLFDLVLISLLGGAISSVFVGAFTVALSVQAYRRGWDLDSVAAPLITAAGDIVTIPSLFLATFAVRVEAISTALAVVSILLAVVATVRGLSTALAAARRVVRQSLPVLVLAGSVDILAGLVIDSRLEHFLEFQVFLVLLPPFLADAGALGAILSSRLSSKLHLGVVTPRGLPERAAVLDATIILLFSLWIFALVGAAADLVARIFNFNSPGDLVVVGVSLLAGVMSTCVAIGVAYYAAVVTSRRGLDPDNYGIPLITSSMDFAGVIALVVAMRAFGVA
ncbi:MAG: magnesium transporter [Actinomycetota bacterium]|nr:magnesium transporter [Actinomycetota bacterium]